MPKTLRPCCRKLVIAAALLAALPAIAGDKDYALTVYGGYRGGGHFTDANTGDTLSLESNGAASMALDIPHIVAHLATYRDDSVPSRSITI